MSQITGTVLRKKYLEFFKNRGHIAVPSAPMVPQNDPTTLFTSSGMQPMIPYLLGETHPEGTRIVDSQRCFRAEDIEEVGDNRHTTAFEMLGNWSLGDYFKKEELPWIFEFLTKEVGLDPTKLYVTVLRGDKDTQIIDTEGDLNTLDKDNEAISIWKDLFREHGIDAEYVDNPAENGMQNGRIFGYPVKKNWWSRSGVPAKMPPGEPGGPDSEIFYEYSHIEHDMSFGPHCHVNCDCGRYGEIGNSVFMQYQKQDDGSFKELAQKNIDFGGGLERILAAAYDNADVFVTDLFLPIIEKIEKLTTKKYENENTKPFRIIADHIKAAVMLASDGVFPSNKAQGYLMRRLIRRAIGAGRSLGLKDNFTKDIVPLIQTMYADQYPQVTEAAILGIIEEEEMKFRKTLDNALDEVKKVFRSELKTHEDISKAAFTLYQSNGLPSDIFLDEYEKAFSETISLEDRQSIQEQYEKLFKSHQELSRSSSAGMFKGGLAEHSEQIIQYHTATHLLQQALRSVLGDHIVQRGSNITNERLRFDFTSTERLTPEQIKSVEEIVNQKIQEKVPVYFQNMSLEIARKTGAIGLFGEKYPDIVKVYTIGPLPESGRVGESIESSNEVVQRDTVFSREFCGGPHVSNTSEIKGIFKIQKDEKISKDVVRIKAVLEIC
ncbi:MAG: alanine--tRNA ligase [bacterium]|nr:alanine--tRNA ligase [bacterium]